MNRLLCITFTAVSLLLVPAADAAKRKLPTDFSSAEGSLIKHLMGEPDAAKKTALMEDFVAKNPTHDSTPWVFGELQTAYMKAGQFDKALAAGEKVLAGDPDDVVIANANLKAAEGAKNPALIRKWAVAASAAARRIITSAKPADADEAAAWQANVDYAKQVDTYGDYALYALALQTTDSAQRIEIGESLVRQSPESQYATLMRPHLSIAYQQAGNHARALAVAEDDIKSNSNNEDMLLYAASKAYERQDKPKAIVYAKRLIDTLPAKPVPQGMNEADWTRNKNLKLGMAQWMLGVIASNEQRWVEADSHLRTALPNVSHSKEITAETLFHLGLSNYKLGEAKKDKNRILEALKFNQQCAAIVSNFQAPAKKNVAAIRSQYHIQ
ncbi:MAG: tetratricopeptide repeat protein [Bryobacteraceae bacterium]